MNNQNIIVYRFNLLYKILKELEEDIYFKIFEVSDESAWKVGLSCGGKLTIYLEMIAGFLLM